MQVDSASDRRIYGRSPQGRTMDGLGKLKGSDCKTLNSCFFSFFCSEKKQIR
eukprot:UN27820